MKTISYCLVLVSLLLAWPGKSADSQGKPQSLKKFTASDRTISKDVTVTEDGAWLAKCDKGRTIRLFEVSEPNVENCMIIYRARIKTEDLTEPAYLEMLCRFSGRGEFFSRGLDHAVTGSNDWASFETPFFLKKGEKPDLIKLNFVVKGSGKIWVKDVELLKARLPAQR